MNLKKLNSNDYIAIARKGFISSLVKVPNEMITKEFCLAIVKRNPYVIIDMPEVYLNLEIFEVACLHDNYYLEFTPEHFKSLIIKKMTKFNFTIIKYIPSELISCSILESACKNDRKNSKRNCILDSKTRHYITQASFIEDSFASECYLSHIKRNGQVSSELYPDETSSAILVKHFFNFKGELNLGANNSTFPLISLMNGLTCLCSNVLLMK